jgi:thiamine pyrophosphate-dependent acetolactate synthase large subunit-like protein
VKVYERLADAFAAEGTRTIFGMMGDGNMYWMHALARLGMRMIEVRHEGAGLGMADGWARATHDVGVCTATCGPGVSQLATALVTASRASSPLVVFAGEYPTSDQEYVQRFDQSRFAEACEAGFVRLTSADVTDDVVRQAFYLAKTESRPVMLSCPMDIQQKEFEDDEPYKPSSTLLPSVTVAPNAAAIAQAADLIATSTMPVVLVGRGAMWSGAGEAVLRLAERIGAVITTSLMAKNWLGEAPYHVGISGFYGTRTAMQLFEEADVVVGVGASLNRYTIEHGYIYPNAKYIQLDIKPHTMMGDGRAADIYVHTDARLGVEALEAELASRSYQNTGYRTAQVKDRLAHHFDDPGEFDVEPDLLDAREVCRVLDDLVPTDFNLVTGSGASAGFTTMTCNRPRQLVIPAHWFGCIGQSLPAAIGTVAATNRPTLLVDGDASVLMHLAELETAVREQMPLLTVVLNDQALGSEYHKFHAHKMDAELATITTPDLGAVMRSFSGKGTLARTIEDVRLAAQEWVTNPTPTVIDARISRQVVTLPYRRMYFGRDE